MNLGEYIAGRETGMLLLLSRIVIGTFRVQFILPDAVKMVVGVSVGDIVAVG